MPPQSTRLCSVDGCGKPFLAKGLCSTHYERERTRKLSAIRRQTETLHATPLFPRFCSIDGCGQPHAGNGLCQHHYNLAYYAAHAEERRAVARADYHAHAEQRKAGSRAWKQANYEKDRATRASYRKAHPEKQRAWQQANRDKFRAYSKAWSKAHPEQVRARQAAWRKANPGKAAANYEKAHPGRRAEITRQRRFNLGKSRGPKLNPGEWGLILQTFGHRCVYCGIKAKRLTMDHVVPISKGGPHVMSNVVPACKSCNSTKGAGLPLKPVQGVLL